FVFIATLLVAALLLLAPLGRAPLLLIAPSRRSPLLFFTPLLLETLGPDGGALGIGRPIRAGRTRGLLSRAHRLLGGTDRIAGTLRLERAARFLLCRARFVLRDARLFLRGLGLRRGGIGFARGVGDGSGLAPDVFEQLGEDAAEGFCRQSSRVRWGLFLGLLWGWRGCCFAARTAQGGEPTAAAGCDLVAETVALLAQPLDLIDQDLPFLAGLLEDLLRGVLGSRQYIMRCAKGAWELIG